MFSTPENRTESRGSERLALLQVPSGRIAYRLPLPVPEPWELEHEGFVWRWSHRCVSGVVYARGRVNEPAAQGRRSVGAR